MKKDFTDITVVLDRSGSMSKIVNDTIGGFDHFVKQQKDTPGYATLTLMQFDTEYDFVYKSTPMENVKPLEIVPRGCTALLDAIGKAIVDTGERLRSMKESERPDKVVFVIITDGEENASREYTKGHINDMISLQRDIYKWEFVFLGANQDAIKEAASIGILSSSAMDYTGTGAGVYNAFSIATANISSYRNANSKNISFSTSDRENAMKEEKIEINK